MRTAEIGVLGQTQVDELPGDLPGQIKVQLVSRPAGQLGRWLRPQSRAIHGEELLGAHRKRWRWPPLRNHQIRQTHMPLQQAKGQRDQVEAISYVERALPALNQPMASLKINVRQRQGAA